MNLPDNFPHQSAAFKAEWQDWVEFRKKELRKPLGPISLKKQVKFLSSMTEAMAICSLEQSMRNNWQGLFPVAKSVTHSQTVNFHEEGGGF